MGDEFAMTANEFAMTANVRIYKVNVVDGTTRTKKHLPFKKSLVLTGNNEGTVSCRKSGQISAGKLWIGDGVLRPHCSVVTDTGHQGTSICLWLCVRHQSGSIAY